MAAEELMSGGQRRTATTARIAAAHLGRHRFGIPVSEFARLFRREESTLRRGVLSFDRRLAGDPMLRQQLDAMLHDEGDAEDARLHV
jgi:hypothetical protein